MLRFLIDAQLPPGLALHLIQRGYIADHVNRIGLAVATDEAIWSYARHEGATLITKDEDFISLSQNDPSGPQIIWIRLGNIGNEALWRILAPIFPDITKSLQDGERIIEVL